MAVGVGAVRKLEAVGDGAGPPTVRPSCGLCYTQHAIKESLVRDGHCFPLAPSKVCACVSHIVRTYVRTYVRAYSHGGSIRGGRVGGRGESSSRWYPDALGRTRTHTQQQQQQQQQRQPLLSVIHPSHTRKRRSATWLQPSPA